MQNYTNFICENNDANINLTFSPQENNCVWLETIPKKQFKWYERLQIAFKFIILGKVNTIMVPTKIKLKNYNDLTFNLLKIRNLFKDAKLKINK